MEYKHLTIENLSKTYIPNKSEIRALDDISLNFPSIGLVGINGKSGSGKTTLLQILAGFLPFDNGKIFIFGEDISKWTEEKFDNYRQNHISYIFQDFNLIDSLTVYENICLSSNAIGKSFSKEEIDTILKNLELYNSLEKYPYELSGGERQRVAIASAIVKKSKIIFADEPTASLDKTNAKNIMEIFKKISKDVLVIIVTHELEFAEEFCDRIITLENGKIVNDLLISEKNEDAYIVKKNGKSKFNFKASFKIAFHEITHKKIKIALFAIICGLLFGLINVFSSLFFYDETRIFFNKMKESVITISNGGEGYNFEDLQQLEEEFGEFNYSYGNNELTIKLHDKCEYDYPTDFLKKDNLGKYYFSNTIKGYVAFDERFLSLDLPLVAGNYPSGDNEVMISKYIFEDFKLFGFENYISKLDKYELINVNNFDDVIGKVIYKDEYQFKIVGIVDTNMERKRFENYISYYYDYYLKGINPKFILTRDYIQICNLELMEELKFGIHNRLFINNSHPYIADFKQGNKDAIFVSIKDKEFKEAEKILDKYLIYDYESPYENGVFTNEKESEFGRIYSLSTISFTRIKEFSITCAPFLVGAFFLFLFITIFFSYENMKSLLIEQKWQLGVLRSKGYNRKDVSTILLVQPFIISILQSIFIILWSFLLSTVFNILLKNGLLFTVSVFKINIISTFLVIASNILVFLVSSFIPIHKMLKTSIHDLICKSRHNLK